MTKIFDCNWNTKITLQIWTKSNILQHTLTSYTEVKWKSLGHVLFFVTPWTVYSPPDTSVHGIHQARILEWVAISFSRGSSQLRDWTWVSCIGDRFFTIWVTREAEIYINKYKLNTVHPWTTWEFGYPLSLQSKICM